jgi:hypothetical protein
MVWGIEQPHPPDSYYSLREAQRTADGRELRRTDGGDDVATCQIANAGKGGADRDMGHARAQSIRPADAALGADDCIFSFGG